MIARTYQVAVVVALLALLVAAGRLLLQLVEDQPRLLQVKRRGQLTELHQVDRWWYDGDVLYVLLADGGMLRVRCPERVWELDRGAP